VSGVQQRTSPGRPLVLVRKASSSRVNLPPLTIAPPARHLPPPPLSPLPGSGDNESVESLVFPDPPSAGSSHMSFASLDDFPTAEEIHHFMQRDEVADPVLYGSPPPLETFEVESPDRGYSEEHIRMNSSEIILSSSRDTEEGFWPQDVMERRGSEASFLSARSSVEDLLPSSSTSNNGSLRERSLRQRIPLPSLRQLNSHGSSAPAESSGRTPSSSSAGSPQPRRRLFSGSSFRKGGLAKGSTSPPPPGADDELRSIISLSLDDQGPGPRDPSQLPPIMMSFANFGNQLSLVTENACIHPMWHEVTDSVPSHVDANRRASTTTDYVPQRIMSPADMLRLEEELADESSRRGHGRDQEKKLDLEPGDFGLAYVNGPNQKASRSRTSSILSSMSSGTMASGEKDGADDGAIFGRMGMARALGSAARRPATATEHTTGAFAADGSRSPVRGVASPHLRSVVSPPASGRPSTAQASLGSPPTSPTAKAASSPARTTTALPPPPRPRARPSRGHIREDSDTLSSKRMSTVLMKPLSPPPPRRRPARPSMHDADERTGVPISRPPSAFNQKALNRRSVMKKPSFLEISDDEEEDDDHDAGGEDGGLDVDTITLADMGERRTVVTESLDMDMESSFLDLDRGNSFDTVRSFDDSAARFKC
jgi:hypothetical protein